MSIGGSKSSGKTTSTSNSSTQGEGYDYGSGMWSGQAPFLQDLYQRSNNQMGQGTNADAMNFLGRSGWADTQGMEQLQGGQRQLANSTGYLASAGGYLNDSANNLRAMLNPDMDPSVAAYSKRIGQSFNEDFLPGLKGDAMLAGGLGGSRQQIGAALGTDRAMQAMSDFNANIYSGQQDRRLAAAQGIGQIGQAFGGLGQISNDTAGIFGNLAQGWQQSAGQNLAAGDFARSMPWYGLNQYAGLLGMPVTLDQGGFNWNNSSSTSTSSGKNSSIGGSFGLK